MSQNQPVWKTITKQVIIIPEMSNYELIKYLHRAESLYEVNCSKHLNKFIECEEIEDQIETLQKACDDEKKVLIQQLSKNMKQLGQLSKSSGIFKQKVREFHNEAIIRKLTLPDTGHEMVRNMLKVQDR